MYDDDDDDDDITVIVLDATLCMQYWCIVAVGTLYDKMVSGSAPCRVTMWSLQFILLWTIITVSDVIFGSSAYRLHHTHHHYRHTWLRYR